MGAQAFDGDRFYGRASEQIEGVVHRIRVALLLLVEARLLVFFGPKVLEGEWKHLVTTAFILGGLAASGVVVNGVRRAGRKEPWMAASAALDAGLAFLVVAPSVLWPRLEYRGVLLAPDFAVWSIVVIGSGFRLSRRVALVGTGVAAAGLATLIALDLAWNAPAYRAPEIALAVVLVAASSALAFGVSGWIRELVARGTSEAILAERARQRLGAYVSTEVAEHVMAQEAKLGGVSRDVAILFSDLRGFTRVGEQLAPDALLADLNAYLECMVSVVHRHGGVVDKYMGDAILAVFGIPERRGDEAGRAVRAAMEMREALHRHNLQRAARGAPPLAHGVGVHFGPVVAGHVGTPERLQYTVIGDTVNVASRLQTATKEVGVDLLVSEAVVARAREEGSALPRLRALEPLSLRGRTVPLAVSTPDP